MKIVIALFLTVLFGKGCHQEYQHDMESTIIEYTANSRGNFYKITIQNQMVFVSRDRKKVEPPVATKLSDADWKKIIADFKEINLEEIPNLKPPTEYRTYDGAMMASLKITYKDKVYETVTFDNGYPPKEIAKLVDKVNSFAKKDD
ncbi:MAG TPA: hypothetical protein VN192_02645 [Flavobacterium sp.]|jgi:hypothetical protein|nr:hypothetical protein [Flavobacterium sp.]